MKRNRPVSVLETKVETIANLRDCERLYVLQDTLNCSKLGCIQCCYKLLVNKPKLVDGNDCYPIIPSNERPDSCLRLRPEPKNRNNDKYSKSTSGQQDSKKKKKKKKEKEWPERKRRSEVPFNKFQLFESSDDSDEDEDDGTAEQKESKPVNNDSPTPIQCGYYNDQQRILVIGDGDFSFSLSLAKKFKQGSNIVSTSYLSEKEILETYKNGRQNMNSLKNDFNATVLNEIDANDLSSLKKLDVRFDVVIFNFPCVDSKIKGADGQSNELLENQTLLKNFFASCVANRSELLKDSAEICVTHKTIEPFCWWQIPDLGTQSALSYLGSIVFDKACFKEYRCRKVYQNKSFPIHDAVTFVFTSSNNDDPSHCFNQYQCNQFLHKVTPEALIKVINTLQFVAGPKLLLNNTKKKSSSKRSKAFGRKKQKK